MDDVNFVSPSESFVAFLYRYTHVGYKNVGK
jgi:hypothetical protein